MIVNKKDKVPGGLADNKQPSDFNNKQLQMGIKVEMEHTDDPEIAKEIAMDHLMELEDYYTRLDNMEKEGKKDRKKKKTHLPMNRDITWNLMMQSELDTIEGSFLGIRDIDHLLSIKN